MRVNLAEGRHRGYFTDLSVSVSFFIVQAEDKYENFISYLQI